MAKREPVQVDPETPTYRTQVIPVKIVPPSLRILTAALILLAAAGGGFYYYWNASSPRSTCESCHEIESSSDMWAHSGHRDFLCKECHGTALSGGLHSLKEKGMMFVHHFRGAGSERIMLDEQQVLEMTENCRRCHGAEYARWLSGGHSATYAAIFLNDRHNKAEQLNADCLRCHGMFYRGKIQDLVTPLSRKGPWKLAASGESDQPVIPCLTCHKIHREGSPAVPAEYAEPGRIFYGRRGGPSTLLFYDRYEKIHIQDSALPLLKVTEGARDVKVSDDPRQRVCVQCHAPDAFHRAGTGDDRTPRGVHEGLSCLACHDSHSNESRQSCINCHPAISNCLLDVTKMNTTFAASGSPHNVHFVRCIDCHTKGIPARRPSHGRERSSTTPGTE